MKLGLDCVAAPTVDVLAAMVEQSGATWLCSYIGGPTALGTGWTAEAHKALAPLLADGFLPTYAGVGWGGPFTAQHGDDHGWEAVSLTGAAGFHIDETPVVLDLEHAAYEAGKGNGIDAYCRAWADAVRGFGAVPILYSSVAGCDALGSLFDGVWVANWIGSGTTMLTRAPDPEGGPTYWQYASKVTLAGVACDANVAQDDAPFARPSGGEQPMPEIDAGWQAKKEPVVRAAGELQTVAEQLAAEAARKAGPRVKVVRQLANDVRQRADGILA